MKEALERFARALQESPARLVDISDADAARPRPDGKWSASQVIGHLIDSASNNHQRWVRAQAGPHIAFPKYEQEFWVETQGYVSERWPDLVNLWLLYNRHLLHLAHRVPTEKLQNQCTIGDNSPVTLEFLIVDYVRHLEQHLGQILAR
jgi:hypothetical protein